MSVSIDAPPPARAAMLVDYFGAASAQPGGARNAGDEAQPCVGARVRHCHFGAWLGMGLPGSHPVPDSRAETE